MNRLMILSAAGVLSICGCGSDLVSVAGTVEREGSRLQAGRVVLTPVGGGRVAVGEIQFDGSFRLQCAGGEDGAAPGQYRVRVIETQVSDAGLLRTSHRAPLDNTVEIAAVAVQELPIRILQAEGWVTEQDN